MAKFGLTPKLFRNNPNLSSTRGIFLSVKVILGSSYSTSIKLEKFY